MRLVFPVWCFAAECGRLRYRREAKCGEDMSGESGCSGTMASMKHYEGARRMAKGVFHASPNFKRLGAKPALKRGSCHDPEPQAHV